MRSLKIDAKHGRIYASGPMASLLVRRMPGAYHDRNAQVRGGGPTVHLSLTLDTLRDMKTALRMTSQELAACCTEPVMRWARAANTLERDVAAVHDRIAARRFVPLPWEDHVHDPPYAPYEHQRVMATVAVDIPGAAFLCEMGTAKTRSAIEAVAEMIRRSKVDVVFVVCPNSVTGTWAKEIPMWTRTLKAVRLPGTVRERAATIHRLTQDNYVRGTTFLLNYEVLDKLKDDILAVAARLRIAVIFDEGHRIRNSTAKVTKAAMKIAAAAPWRLLMTGTPIVNGIENIWSQWYVVDLGIAFGANYVQFRREFFEENAYTFTLDPLENTAAEVNKRIRRRGVRYKKS
ncbi:MAG TPA: SNF2-related protein, partial [Acidimicrobiia bacterium]|nr:SNF2-related protein [Acidimicrobiia bacterium]